MRGNFSSKHYLCCTELRSINMKKTVLYVVLALVTYSLYGQH